MRFPQPLKNGQLTLSNEAVAKIKPDLEMHPGLRKGSKQRRSWSQLQCIHIQRYLN
jgi:hypothetical protein